MEKKLFLDTVQQINQYEIDKSSPIPLHLQLRNALEKKINEGHFSRNDSFLSELEICETYFVSRTPVRQTLREMINDGLLYRKVPRGRLLVAPIKVQQKATRLEGFFTEDVLHSGLQPKTKVISTSEIIKPSIALNLGIKEDEPIICITRLHEGNEEPLVLQTSYIPKKMLPNIYELDFTRSIFSLIEHHFGHKLVSAKQQISVRLPTSHEKMQLQLPSKVCIFQVNRITYANNGLPVEYFECILRGDRYNFSMDLTN